MGKESQKKAACPLDGGALSSGSTCGVVSGGCLAMVLAHRADLLCGDPGKIAAVYGELKDYTRWFEQEFGSSECRDLVWRSFGDASELASYLAGSETCARIEEWCGAEATRLIREYQ